MGICPCYNNRDYVVNEKDNELYSKASQSKDYYHEKRIISIHKSTMSKKVSDRQLSYSIKDLKIDTDKSFNFKNANATFNSNINNQDISTNNNYNSHNINNISNKYKNPIAETRQSKISNTSLGNIQTKHDSNNNNSNNNNYNTTNFLNPNNKLSLDKSYLKAISIQFDKSNFINMKTKNLFEEYKICDRIGQGAYGSVYKTCHKTMKFFRAVKAIKRSSIDEVSFFNEMSILKNVDHPNIIKLFETYYDSGYYYLVEEFCSGGDMYDYIKKQKYFSERKAAKIIGQLLHAVNHLHTNKIVHRDLKPENIVIENIDNINTGNIKNINGSSMPDYLKYYQSKNSMNTDQNNIDNIHIKLIDFGTSIKLKGRKLSQELGTIYYIAPEVFKGNYDERCDIWSCGIILYILLCGHPPFRGNKENEIKAKIINFDLRFNDREWGKVSKEAINFVKSLLTYNYALRPTAQEALNNNWLKSTLINQEDNILDNIIIRNLAKFHSSLILQKAVLNYLSNQIQSEDIRIIQEEFSRIDENKDGVISRDELTTCMRKLYAETEAIKKVDEVFEQVDFNNDGKISFSEFVTVSSKIEKIMTNEMLKKAFDMFDLDGNGFITKEELDETLPISITEDTTWNELIKEVDLDGDGKINFEEFVNMMEKFAVNSENSC